MWLFRNTAMSRKLHLQHSNMPVQPNLSLYHLRSFTQFRVQREHQRKFTGLAVNTARTTHQQYRNRSSCFCPSNKWEKPQQTKCVWNFLILFQECYEGNILKHQLNVFKSMEAHNAPISNPFLYIPSLLDAKWPNTNTMWATSKHKIFSSHIRKIRFAC